VTRRMRHRSAEREGGAAAVEFALVSLILFPLLFGMMGFALVLWAQQSVDHAAREGARLAAVGVPDCTAWRNSVMNRGRGVEWLDKTPSFSVVEKNGVTGFNAGDEVVVTLKFLITGAPGTLVEIASVILPGDGSAVRLPDGSDGVALVREAKARNEANADDVSFKSACEGP